MKNNNIKTNLNKIKNAIKAFSLPDWDELPPIYLYMDQVIELTSKYFDAISILFGEEKTLTPPMINNYIKLKAMPAPNKKRYGKTHLAYLLMISSLKQSMNISSMKNIIPVIDDEEKIKEMYNNFVKNQKKSLAHLAEIINPVLENANAISDTEEDTILQIVLSANYMKIFASGITVSDDKAETEISKAEIKKNHISVKANAKINLCLDVGNKRLDGYHNVNMIMQEISLYDTIDITVTEDEDIVFICDNDQISQPPDNLCYKAAKMFFEKTGLRYGCTIKLSQNIPICSGLGGGSSDAAATLKALNKICGSPLDMPQLLEIGLKLGADVPFCIMGGTAVAKGIGEQLTPIKGIKKKWVAVIKPNINISTRDAYNKMDTSHYLRPDTDKAAKYIQEGKMHSFYSVAGNSFESVIGEEHSQIEDIKNYLLEKGSEFAMMSGSGPTVYGIFSTKKAAQTAFSSYEGAIAGGGVAQFVTAE